MDDTAQQVAFLVNRWCWRCVAMRQMVRYFHSSGHSPKRKVTIHEPYTWLAYQCRLCGAWAPGQFDSLMRLRMRNLKVTVNEEPGKVQIVIQP